MLYRHISRTVLIPFIACDGSTGSSLTASDRARVDDELQKAIKNANMAAGTMIRLGQTLQTTKDQAIGYLWTRWQQQLESRCCSGCMCPMVGFFMLPTWYENKYMDACTHVLI